MNNNDFSLRIIAALNKQLSKRQIKSDLKTMDDSLYVKVIAKLSKTLSKQQLKKELKQLNDLYVNIGANVKVDKNAKSQLQNRIKELQKSISDIEIKTKVNTKSGNSGIDSARRTMQAKANRTSVSFNLEVKKNKAIADIEYLGKRFSRLFSNVSAKSKYENILTQAYSISDKSDLQSVRSQIAAFTSELKANGLASQSLVDKYKKLTERFKELFSAASIVRTIFTQVRQAVTETIELDTAITDVWKVTENIASRDEFSGLLTKWNKLAQNLSVTTKSLISSVEEWSKIGFDLDMSEQLAQITAIFEKTAEISNEKANSTLISVAQAFPEIDDLGEDDYVERVALIGDKINKVGNEFAIDSEGVSDALQNSSAALRMANNDLNESIAIVTTANKIFQNPDEVGNMSKVLSARIRGQKGELEALNEDTDGMIESVSKIQTQILNLTQNRVNIFESDNETIKSTYEIIKEIGQIYESLSDKDQADLLEILAGKQRMSAVASLLLNYEELEKVKEASMNADGSMQEEYNKYLESAEAHIVTFKEKLTELYSSFMSGDLIKHTADIGSAILDLVNKTDLLKHGLVAIATIKIGQGISAIGAGISSAVKQMDTLGGALQQIKNLPLDGVLRDSAMKQLGDSTKSLTEKNLKLLLSQKRLNDEDRMTILQRHNLTEEQAKEKLAKLGLTTATNANTAANTANATSVTTLKGTFTKLTTSIKATWTAMSGLEKASIIFAAVSTAYSVVSSVISSHNQALEEAKEKTKELADEAVKEEENIESLIKQYNELDKTDRSTENTEKIKSLNESINETLGNQADNLDLVNGKLDEQSDKLKRNLLLKLQDDQGDIDANVAATSTEYEKGISFGTFGNDTSGDVAKALYDAGIDTWYKNSFYSGVDGKLYSMSADEQLIQLKDWRDRLTEKYKETGNYGEEVELLNKWYNELNTKKEERDKALQDQQLRDEKERILSDWNEGKIGDAEAFQAYRDEIQETYKENSVLQNQMLDFIDNLFPDFAKKLQETKQTASEEISIPKPKTPDEAWKSIDESGSKEQKKEKQELENALKDEYQKLSDWGLSDYEEQIKSGTMQSKFGNVDMDKRTIIEWSDELKKTYADELASWNYDPEVGSIDTVFGGSSRFGENLNGTGWEVAFTPILPDGTLLGQDTVYDYINSILKEAYSDDGKVTGDELKKIDAEGRQIGDTFVKGIFAGIDDSQDYDNNKNKAKTIGKLMHFSGTFGAVSLAEKAIQDAKKKYARSLKDTIDYDAVFKKEWKSIGTSGDEKADKKALEAKEKLLELAEAGKLTEEVLSNSPIAKTFEDAGVSIKKATEEINKMKSSADQLASMKTGISSISSILGEKKENLSSKKTRTKGIGADTLAGMPEDVKAQKKEYENFVKVLGNGESKMEDCKDAANKLATSYINSNNFLANLTEGKEDYYTSVLKEMGVENAAEIVTAALNKQKVNAKMSTFDLTTATEQEMEKLGNYVSSLDDSSKALGYYTLQQQIANNNALDTSDSIENLKSLAKQCGITGEAIHLMSSLAKDMKQVEYYTTGDGKNDKNAGEIISNANSEIKGNTEKLNKIINKGAKLSTTTSKITPKDPPDSKKKKDKSKSKSTQQIDWISRALDRLSSRLDLVKAKYDNLFKNKKAKDSDSMLTLQNKNLNDQYKILTKIEKYQDKAAKKYSQKAKKVKISKNKKEDASLKKAVREGRINGNDMSKLIATYGEKKAEKIQEYQDWYSIMPLCLVISIENSI